MESAAYLTFVVRVEDSVRNDLYICRDYHVQPSEIGRMPYWKYEIMLETIKEINKKQEEDEKRRDRDGTLPGGYKMPQMPQMPSMPQMPKVSIPNF